MPISVDSRGAESGYSTANPHDFTHTCSGTNRILLVEVAQIASRSDLITGVTYNGVSMTRTFFLPMANTRSAAIYGYHLTAPSTGTNTISVSKTTTTQTSNQAGSYNGVHQTNPVNIHATHTLFNASSISTTITTTVDDCWMVGMLYNSNFAPSPTNSLTTSYESPLQVNGAAMADSNGSLGPAGTYTGGENAGVAWEMIGLYGLAPAPSSFRPRVLMY